MTLIVLYIQTAQVWMVLQKAELESGGLQEENAKRQAKIFRTQTKNGIWWLQQKQKVLNLMFPLKTGAGEEKVYTYEEMFGLNNSQMLASNMYMTQQAAGSNCETQQSYPRNHFHSHCLHFIYTDIDYSTRSGDLNETRTCGSSRSNLLPWTKAKLSI